MNNKGSVFDLFIVIAMLFGTAIAIIIGYKIIQNIQSVWIPTDATAIELLNSGTGVMTVFNYGFLIITVGLVLLVVVSAFTIKTHPIFFVFSILMLGLVLIVAPPLSNSFNYLVNMDEMAGVISNFGILNTIMQNLPKIAFGFGVLVIVVLYAKSQSI